MVNCSTTAGAVEVEHSLVLDKQVISAYFYLQKISCRINHVPQSRSSSAAVPGQSDAPSHLHRLGIHLPELHLNSSLGHVKSSQPKHRNRETLQVVVYK